MLRILLVEDSAILVDRLRETLGALEGVEVVDAVADESAAVVVATARPVDVIVLDLQLREGTGFGVLQRLGSERPEVIVFTGYDMPEYKGRASALGVRHFLIKARDHERLPALIRELERQRRDPRA
jgi:two-component system, OmpR family, response regulator